MQSVRKGLFLVLEGIDGSGKTTQHRLLTHYLQNHYEEMGFSGVVAVREPGGTAAGEQIRDIVLHLELDTLSQALLFLAARSQLMQEVVIPALNQNKIVISDRFELSTWVYQMQRISNSLLDANVKFALTKAAAHRFNADLTILLEVSTQTAMSRLRNRGRQDVMDGTLQDIEDRAFGYARINNTQGGKLVRVSAEGPEYDVFDSIVHQLNSVLDNMKLVS